MKKGRIGGRRVFAIIIDGIIVGILVLIAVPLYKGHVERKRVTEATSIMGAIITSQKVEKQRTTNYYAIPLGAGGTDILAFKNKGIDITDTKFFTYQTATIGVKPNDGFTVTATSTAEFGTAGGTMTYTYDPTASPASSWAPDGTIILDDLLLLQT